MLDHGSFFDNKNAPPIAANLIEECHWLINMDVRKTNLVGELKQFDERVKVPTRNNNEEGLNLCKQKSPYRQHLGRSKAVAPSPAQRAAKNILKIQKKLLRLDGKWLENRLSDTPVATTQLQRPVNKAGTHAQSKTTELSLTASIIETSEVSPREAKTFSLKRKKKCMSTYEEYQLAEKQERLAKWFTVHSKIDSFIGHKVDTSMDISSLCSVEVKAQIRSAVQRQSQLGSKARL